jgi:solute carrier family 35 protein E3
MVIYKFFGQGQGTPLNSLLSLCLVLIGLSLFSVNDVQFNLIGSILAAVAVITTTVYQTQTNVLQRSHAVTGMQLNHAVSLSRSVIAFIASLVIETHGSHNIFEHDFHGVEIVLILLTGFLAVLGNCVGFSLIGRAGPITFQVVGHLKTMVVFVFGLLMFPVEQEPPEKKWKKNVGLSVSVIGVVLYTVFEIGNKDVEGKPRRVLEEQQEGDTEGNSDLRSGSGTIFENTRPEEEED